jgi:hypothetical protein
MTVRLLDTLTGDVRPLTPLREDVLGIYSCGPTVYGPGGSESISSPTAIWPGSWRMRRPCA